MSLQQLEGLLEEYSPMINELTERAVDRAIRYGAAFAEVIYPFSTWNEQGIDT